MLLPHKEEMYADASSPKITPVEDCYPGCPASRRATRKLRRRPGRFWPRPGISPAVSGRETSVIEDGTSISSKGSRSICIPN